MGKPVTLYGTDDTPIFSNSLATYTACVPAAFTPPATPNDVMQLTGATGKVIRVLRAWINTTQTTAGLNTWFLIKRSATNSGGTPSAWTPVPMDSADPAVGAVARHYTANPGLGTAVGNILVTKVNAPAPATAGMGAGPTEIYWYSFEFGKPIVLRSAAESIAWNFAGAAVPTGLAVLGGFTWTEETVA